MSKWSLTLRCVSQYLEEYTDEVLDDELYKVG